MEGERRYQASQPGPFDDCGRDLTGLNVVCVRIGDIVSVPDCYRIRR